MEFFETLGTRHSVRAFLDKEVEDEKIRKILEACNSAPSAGNLQAYEIFVVTDMERKMWLADAALGQSFVAKAPVVLVFLASPKASGSKYGKRGENLYCIQDATIAAAYSQLAAVALGLGSAWVGAFDEDGVRTALDAEGLVPVAIIPVGYASGKRARGWHPVTRRKSLGDLVRRR